MREEINPILENGWKLISGTKVEPIVKEIPPTVMTWFTRGEYTEFELLKKAFAQEFYLNSRTTSLWKLLQEATNSNLEAKKSKASAGSRYRYTPVDDNMLWKLLGAFMIQQLQLNGNNRKLNWASEAKPETFMGKGRFKV